PNDREVRPCGQIVPALACRRGGPAMSQPISVVVPVYDGVTQLDFTGPHQFLSRTPDLHVRVASLGGEPVTADRLTFSNLDDLAAIESCDVLLVPRSEERRVGKECGARCGWAEWSAYV